MPTNFIWIGFYWITGKCYVNSIMAALNARDLIRDRAALSGSTFAHMPSKVFRSTASGYHCSGEPMELMNTENTHKDNPSLAVNVHTEVKTGTIYEEHVVSLHPSAMKC